MASEDFAAAFESLKRPLSKHLKRLAVKTDAPAEYTLVTKSPSPFPQHKGQPMFFAMVKIGKAYVSFHLLPVYMNPPLAKLVSPGLKKRMQGKACFNFKTAPDRALIADLTTLVDASMKDWAAKKWL